MPNFQWLSVGAFGGGVDYTKNPSALDSQQWSDSTGFFASDTYAETCPALAIFLDLSTVLGANDAIIGFAQNPIGGDFVIGTVNTATFAGRLFRVTRDAVVTEITGAGVVLHGNPSAVLQGAFLNGTLLLNFGFFPFPFAAFTTLALWDGGAAMGFGSVQTGFHFLCGFAGHAVGAFGSTAWSGTVLNTSASREVVWSPSNDENFLLPDISNDADDVILDDLLSGIALLAPVGNSACAIFTRNSVSVLAPTGGSIPAFTRQLVEVGLGALQITTMVPNAAFRGQSFWGNTPAGVVFGALDNLYLVTAAGSAQPIGEPIHQAWIQDATGTAQPAVNYHQTFVWHEKRGILHAPAIVAPGNVCFLFDPRSGAWSRVEYPVAGHGTYARSAYLQTIDTSGLLHWDYWVATQQQLYVESDIDPIAGGTVDTKDFCFGSPPFEAYIDRIKVDWECLTNDATDTITILAAPRDALAPGLQGTPSLRIQPTFQVLGTLTGQESELSVRLKAKWVRFRFQQTSGHVRIRGFHIRYQPASDVKT